MLNREKFSKEILDIVCDGENVAVVDGKPRVCEGTPCGNCTLDGGCRVKLKEWANSEYVKPPVDWSKVSVDAKILVRTHEDSVWERRHFAKYEDGKIYAWSDGLTSWSYAGSINVSAWECAKLAESEESHD